MSFAISPNLDAVYASVKAFIMAVLPLDNAHVIKGTINRVAMPTGPFAEMWVATQKRLSTNVDTWDASDPAPDGISRSQSIQLEMQVSLYGPASGDWAPTFTTLFRDPYGCDALAPACQPLHADEPMRAPLVTGEEQYLDKWIVRGQIQYTPVVTTVDQFANVVTIDVVSVDATYPP